MTSILKVDEIQNTDGKTGLVITPDGSIDGVKFPQEAVPSGRTITSTTLDSYEAGTWVPKLEFRDSTTGSLTYTLITVGSYVRIGRSVQISARIGWTANNITASQGALCMMGLPFSTTSYEGDRGGAVITYSDQIIANVADIRTIAFRGEMATKYMILNYATANGSNMRTQITNTSQLSSSGGIILFGYYNTDE